MSRRHSLSIMEMRHQMGDQTGITDIEINAVLDRTLPGDEQFNNASEPFNLN